MSSIAKNLNVSYPIIYLEIKYYTGNPNRTYIDNCLNVVNTYTEFVDLVKLNVIILIIFLNLLIRVFLIL